MEIEYTLIRSRRKTISVEVGEDAKVTVRAPKWMPKRDIKEYVDENSDWIREHQKKAQSRNKKADNRGRITDNELDGLAILAMSEIPEKVRYYADILGVTYGQITVRNQKSLWASCTSKGNLSFNCLLMKTPEHIRDYVIVHELCHRMEMNHSRAFWEHVGSVIPDYKKCRQWLKEEGTILLRSAHNREGEY